jgi:D-alanyl-D-alanine dipeptidase
MRTAAAVLCLAVISATPRSHSPLPTGFVYLSDVAPSIVRDIRYAGEYNPLGRPLSGYDAAQCILTKQAALALAAVQHELEDAGLTLRVYDCYRPQRSVNAFYAWSLNPGDDRMKAEFYPRADKASFVERGYVESKSDHSRGSSVDATIERLPLRGLSPYVPGQELRSCIAPFRERSHDGSLDMGTNYDCFDELSNSDAEVGPIAESHRKLLASVMHRHGFVGAKNEWWHFTLRWEPYPRTYFDFPIVPKRSL